MTKRPGISATVMTLNEAKKIEACLASLDWVDECVVVDSGSTDGTQVLAQKCGARVIERPWAGYGQQKNFAMAECRHDWVLSIDADEIVSPELRVAVEQFLTGVASGREQAKGASLARRTWYLGRWIWHGGWYPNRLVRLVDRRHGRWTEPAVHEALQVDGPVRELHGDILHYSFDSVGDQVLTNVRFSRLGAKVAKERGERATIWKILVKPLGKFLETYVWKRGCLDGFAGFVISVNAAHSMFMKYVELRLDETHSRRR